jgi:hypothetical protein
MKPKSVGMLTAILAIALAADLRISNSNPTEDKLEQSASLLVKSAQDTLAAIEKYYETGRASAEDVYQWSRRVAEAARQESPNGPIRITAAQDHVNRMKLLHDRVAELHKLGMKGGDETIFQATRYYVIAAEQELELMKLGRL